MNNIELRGRRAIITGGARGLGYAIAKRLLQSGASAVLWDRDANELRMAKADLSSLGAVYTALVDVTKYEEVEAGIESSNAAMGGIDIMVCNAGIAGPSATTWEYPLATWREVIEIDLNGVFHCLRAVVPQMIDQDYGRICSTASIAGKEGNPNAGAYSAAKAGVIALTKSLGKELAAHNISVNCITPAAARTRIFEQISQEHIDYMLSKIPRGRFVEVSEIASMVAWLVSEENSFTTGAVFDLSGGRATY
ncbi:MAG: SDR family NAD(P)-dependent oxidoreductase [Pseudomonadota bacterium]